MRKLALCLSVFSVLACAPDEGTSDLPASGQEPGPNASIIRNPVADAPEAATDGADVARMEFESIEHRFGEVDEGTVVRHDFTFTNTGSVPLLITSARSTCGCTVPSYPEQPIAPGEDGVVSVEFNTAHKYGRQRKPVTITANTYPAMTTIYMDGTIIND